VTNIYFINTLLPDRTFHYLFEKHNVKITSAQHFFSHLANGLAELNGTNLSVHSILPINSTDQRKILWSFPTVTERGIRFKHIPSLNLPLLNDLFKFIYVFIHVLFQRFDRTVNNVVLVDYLRFTVNLAVILACRVRRIPIITVVTDLPGVGATSPSFKSSYINRVIFNLKYDYYVCLTKELEKRVNFHGKPSLIMEGLVDNYSAGIVNRKKDKYPERTIVYAGALHEEYGLVNLIKGFSMLSDPNLRLWFYGVGPFLPELLILASANSRVEYMGVVPREELLPLLMKATLLVNPRPSHDDYTRFTFPSKNMEYMATGTPLVTCRLPGIPKDHEPYVYFFDDETAMGIAESLRLILVKNDDDLHVFGERCKQFVIREKNNVLQAKRILDLVESNA
jgi:glycosyltransferase involved in cell wall biosynthesis